MKKLFIIISLLIMGCNANRPTEMNSKYRIHIYEGADYLVSDYNMYPSGCIHFKYEGKNKIICGNFTVDEL